MGQLLNSGKNDNKPQQIPESLKSIKKAGFLKAFFTFDELKKLLRQSGRLIIPDGR